MPETRPTENEVIEEVLVEDVELYNPKPAKKCGTCVYFKPRKDPFLRGMGDCNATIPACIEDPDPRLMHDDSGTKCPCWQENEDDYEL